MISNTFGWLLALLTNIRLSYAICKQQSLLLVSLSYTKVKLYHTELWYYTFTILYITNNILSLHVPLVVALCLISFSCYTFT
jgi:hypothetical protein